jgi:tetratricopeptide (TPR) repeat protein
MAVPALLVLVVYLRAAWLGLSWDDAALTVDNPSLASAHGLWDLWTQETWKASGLDEQASYYRPVATTTTWLVARVSNTAAAHHVTNVVLHAGNAALVAHVLRSRLRAAPLVACLLASFWAVATANSEAVLWISGRFDVLATTFLLVAFAANAGARRWVVPLAFAGALLTKEVAIGGALVLALDDVVLQRRAPRERWPDWVLLVAVDAAYLAVRRAVGIATGDAAVHALGWLLPAFASIASRVFAKLFVPVGLDPLQPLHLLPVAGVVAVFVALGALALVATRRARRDAASWGGAVLVGLSWFVLTLAPMSVIPPGEPVAGDRYGYAASVGVVIALAAVASALGSARSRPVQALLGGLVVLHSVLTELRLPAWQDRESIARSMAAAHPDSAHAHYLLGYLALERRDLPEADAELSRSLAVTRSWRALDAACVLELRRDRLDAAERYCVESATAEPTNPRVWVNLASVHVKGRRWQQALEAASRAVALKPRYAEAHYLAGVSAANLGLLPLAGEHVEAGLAAAPSHRGLLRLREQLARRAP